MDGNHEIFMKRCIELATLGLGNTSPNPMVGSVVVHDGKIISEGYHRLYGEPHAEVNAVNAVQDKSLLKDSTLYVNLEPCSHYGKTPPCAEMIVRFQIPRVVMGTYDPNPLVSGKGVEILRKSGCEVLTGVLEKECEELNKRFFTFQRLQRPYIILKWAETADGFIDKLRSKDEMPEWISNEASKIMVHKWRSEEQAIMIGTNTALMDNPQLNVREWHGKDPLRIVLDDHLRLPQNLKVFDGKSKTIIYTLAGAETILHNVEFIKVPEGADKLSFIFNHLYQNRILSVIVEGGAKLAGSIIERNSWDEARVFIGSTYFHEGVKAPHLYQQPVMETDIDGVRLRWYRNI